VSCNDYDACTQNDVCIDGQCRGTPYDCDDGLECTADQCDGKGGCDGAKLVSGLWCLIGGACYGDGELNPANACEACVTPVSPTGWSAADGATCDDGLECTADDQCQGGVCKGGKDPCDDDNPCTTNGCKEGEGCIHAALQGACEDGDFCTLGDTCTNQVCNPGPKSLDCSDGDPCTQDECVKGGGCLHAPHNGTCDDGDPCSLNDVCALGECTGGADKPSCDDSNACTNDSCLAGVGCIHVPNLVACEDGNPCSEGDTCSGGQCAAGFFIKECDDGDPCTQDFCEANVGCKAVPKTGTCDDGNPCTEGDKCFGGVCKGSTPTECDDGNLCTDDLCNAKVEGGCVFEFNTAPCEDDDPCSISACNKGACVPSGLDCDDGNVCTIDICEGDEGCTHTLDGSSDACLLSITITSPKRAITLTGNKTITVKGKVQHPAAPLEFARLNGKDLKLKSNGTFQTTVKAKHGMNVLFAEVKDELGNTDKAMRSFYYSTKYQPMSSDNPTASKMPKSLYLYMGPPAIDDGNHSMPPDDLATIFEVIIGAFDIGALLPNPLVENSNYKVTISNVSFKPAEVQLVPIAGGLNLYATIDDLYAKVSAKGKCTFCPSASGKITVSRIIISSDVGIKTKNGKVDATLKKTDVILVNPDVDINGILGSILDFIVDFVVDQLAPTIEGAFEKELGKVVPDTLEDALNSLAFDTKFDIPPLFDGGKAVKVTLKTGLETTFWTEDGGTFRMWAAATTPKKVSHSVLGTLRRDGCGSGSENLALSQDEALQIALGDDMMNQILFSIWWGGGLKFPIPASLLAGQDLTQFGVTDLALELDFLLPPIVSACNQYNDVLLQIGDIAIHVTMKLFDQPVELDLFASMEAYLDFVADSKGLGLEVADIKDLKTEVVVNTAGFGTVEQLVDNLVGDQLTPLIFGQLGDGALAGFPLPEIDLGGLADGVPEGTVIAINPKNVDRDKGWTVIGGEIK